MSLADIKNIINIKTDITEIEPDEQILERLSANALRISEQMQDIDSFYKTGDVSYFSAERINKFLALTPDIIAQAELDVAHVERDYLYAKNDTVTIKAQLWNEANLPENREKYSLSSAEDRKCWVQVKHAFQVRQRTEYEWRMLLAYETAILNKYNNIFTAYRKIANLVELDQTNVYRQ